MKGSFCILALSMIPVFSFLPSASGQVSLEWARVYGKEDQVDVANGLARDTAGDVYVVGESGGRPTMIKYSPHGKVIWVRQHGVKPFPGRFSRVAVDTHGGVCATGADNDGHGITTMITVKYAPDGTLLWESHYDLEGLGSAAQLLALAPDGDILVAGVVITLFPAGYPNENLAVLRYSPSGKLRWMRHYDGSSHLTDWSNGLVVDSVGNAYVTGYSDTESGYRDCVTISYTRSGEQRWLRLYDGGLPGGETDYGHDLALAPDERSLYVVGRTTRGTGRLSYDLYHNWLTIKYDSASGHEQWVRFYGTDQDSNGGAVDLVVDEGGAFYVTGSMDAPDGTSDLAVVAYNSEGDELWSMRRGTTQGEHEAGFDITLAPDGTLIVDGLMTPKHDYPYFNFLVMGYDRSGAQLWDATYGVGKFTRDLPAAEALIVDPGIQSIYIAGSSDIIGEEPDWVTLKLKMDPSTPVELLDISARQEGCGVVLEWGTTQPLAGCDVFRYEGHGVGESVQVNRVPLLPLGGRFQITDHGTLCEHSFRYEILGTTMMGTRRVLGGIGIVLNSLRLSTEASLLAAQAAEPNPASSSTSIRFTLARTSIVHFDMADVLGRFVIRRELGELPAGDHRISLAGTDDRERTLPNGIYYYHLRIPGGPVVAGRVLFMR